LYFSSLFFFFCFLFIAFFFLELLSPFFNFLIRNVIVPLLFFLIFLSYFLTPLPPSLFLSYTSHKRRSKSEQLNSVLEFKRCANVSFHLSSSFNSTWDLCFFCWKK
jgi:ABC-type transport system involved in multi-copper enzyme maturation permease subunit